MNEGSVDAKATHDEWYLKVLLNLVGPRKPFKDGWRAMTDVHTEIINECWNIGFNQYQAADYYLYRTDGGECTPTDWLRMREILGISITGKNPEVKTHEEKIEKTNMFLRKNEIEFSKMMFVVGLVIGALAVGVLWFLIGRH